MEVIVRFRHEGEEGAVYLHELEDDIRAGRIPPTAELQYAPWTGERFLPMGSIEHLSEVFDAPGARFALHLRMGPWPWLSTLVTLVVLASGVLQLAVVVLGGRMGAWGHSLSGWFSSSVTGFDPLVLDAMWLSPWTSQLVHGGPGHLFPNLAVLGYAGFRVERAIGTGGYAVVAAASVLSGSLAVALLEPLPVMGSSLLGYGLFGALLAIGFRFGDSIPEHYRRFYGYGNLTLFAFLFISGLGLENASHTGHAGSLVAGFLCGMVLSTETMAAKAVARSARRRNLAVAAAICVVPVSFAPLARHNPSLVFRDAERVENAQAGVSLVLPRRLLSNEGRLRGLSAWSTSVVSREAVFCGLERVSESGVPEEDRFLANWSVKGLGLGFNTQPVEPLGPGWVARGARLPAPRGGRPVQVVEQQLQRGEWVLRLGYLVEEQPDGSVGGRAGMFERVIRTVEVSEPPKLVEARTAWKQSPDAVLRGVAYARQLGRMGRVLDGDAVLRGYLDGSQNERASAARLEFWARYSDSLPQEVAAWAEALSVEDASSARLVGQVRYHLALGDCEVSETALSELEGRANAAAESPALRLLHQESCVSADTNGPPG